MDIFEKEFDGVFISENVAQTNRYYGGRSIPITNVVFPNGAIDPWHAMGVTEDISPTAKAIFMKGRRIYISFISTVIFIQPQLAAS